MMTLSPDIMAQHNRYLCLNRDIALSNRILALDLDGDCHFGAKYFANNTALDELTCRIIPLPLAYFVLASHGFEIGTTNKRARALALLRHPFLRYSRGLYIKKQMVTANDLLTP
ncbi:hypothetical protein NDU88_004820 [Pleurodeles waltl]|uniref:Uncharacterized protein n=1 Tax=Pleurodeles waltl TaxID=8319 RepID=A0AAV7LL16_PLEWA|nr:hypothetical protein NDU88_004820 [Pleurodeles waltl]